MNKIIVRKHRRRKKLGGTTIVQRHLRKNKGKLSVSKRKFSLIKDPVITALTIALDDADPNIRKKAIEAIGDLELNDSLLPLGYALLNDSCKQVRIEAAKELGDLESPAAINVLTKALSQADEDSEIKKEIIKSLKKIRKHNKHL